MTETIPHAVKMELLEYASRSPDREICGFIMKDWWVEPVENVAAGSREFYMNEQHQLHVMTAHKDEIIGVYHSHPSGTVIPSPKDIENAPRHMRYWIIAGGQVMEWVIKNGVAEAAKADPEVVA